MFILALIFLISSRPFLFKCFLSFILSATRQKSSKSWDFTPLIGCFWKKWNDYFYNIVEFRYTEVYSCSSEGSHMGPQVFPPPPLHLYRGEGGNSFSNLQNRKFSWGSPPPPHKHRNINNLLKLNHNSINTYKKLLWSSRRSELISIYYLLIKMLKIEFPRRLEYTLKYYRPV